MDGYALREATLADAPLLARHRRAMFEAMGTLRPETRRRVLGENAAALYRL